MKNLRPIQLFVRDELNEFLSMGHREYFARNHQELIDNLRKEQWIEGNDWKPNYQCFDDFVYVSELARFLDDLELWNEEIGEIRGDYFYDKTTNELPEQFLFVFGFTSPITKRLDYLKTRCEVIVQAIDCIVAPIESLGEPVGRTIPDKYRSRPMPKKEAINFIGRPTHCQNERQALRWFSQSIKDGEYPCEELNKKSYVFDVRKFPEKARKEMRAI